MDAEALETERLQYGITLRQARDQFRLGTDALLLADFARPKPGAAICELCAGAGAVSLLLAGRDPRCRVTAVELQAEACALARENIRENGLGERVTLVEGDLREYRTLLPAGRFDDVVCNPPYYPVGAGKQARRPAVAAARTELFCTVEDVCAAAGWLLRTGGSLWMVHLPSRLCDVFCALRAAGLEPKRLRPVGGEAGRAPSLVLIRAVRGGRAGLEWE